MSDNKETTSKIKMKKILSITKIYVGRRVFEELKFLMIPITKIIIKALVVFEAGYRGRQVGQESLRFFLELHNFSKVINLSRFVWSTLDHCRNVVQFHPDLIIIQFVSSVPRSILNQENQHQR